MCWCLTMYKKMRRAMSSSSFSIHRHLLPHRNERRDNIR